MPSPGLNPDGSIGFSSKRRLSSGTAAQYFQSVAECRPHHSLPDSAQSQDPASTIPGRSTSTSDIAPQQLQQWHSAKRLRLSQNTSFSSLPPTPASASALAPYSSLSHTLRSFTASVPVAMSKASGARLLSDAVIHPSLRPHTGAKKLVVKNLRSQDPSRDAALKLYYTRLWEDIDEALTDILEDRHPSQPYDELYKGVEDICRSGNGRSEPEALYRRLEMRMEEHLSSKVLANLDPAARDATTESRIVDLLASTKTYWKNWTRQISTIRNVFSFLDRSYLLSSRHLMQLNDLAITLFKRILSSNTTLTPTLLDGICLLVRYQREDSPEKDPQLLKDLVSMINVLTMYTRQFEPVFLRDSRLYFAKIADEHAESDSLVEYVEFCNTYLLREEERCLVFNFDSSTKKQLLKSANLIFVADRKHKLLDPGEISQLLEDNKVETIRILFHLLKHSGLDKQLKGPWEGYIEATGTKIVNDGSRADEMVVRLLLLRRNLDNIVRDAFGKNDEFIKCLREAFGHFVNDQRMNSTWGTGTSKVGEMVAKYIDMLLRGGIKALPQALLASEKDRQAGDRLGQSGGVGDWQDAELDRQLDNALELFRFIEGKDVFEAFYKQDMARRLLMNRSASQDAERNMLTKFRAECGSNFTKNLEQMFKDRELANEDMRAYKAYCEGKGIKGDVDLQVNILSSAAWPSYPEVSCKLPPEIHKKIQDFGAYYVGKHTNRVLTWKHNLAQCVVRAKFARGPKELLVSGFQAVVLLLFNKVDKDDELSHEYISKETGIPATELNLTLQSLACGRVRVLTKKPRGKEVHSSDHFIVNNSFWDPKFRIKINTIQMKETLQENKEIHERVAADRMFETQAAIVRIMKSRRQISHNELVAEVINATKKRGAIDLSVLKQNIEKLIDKDYMERDSETGEYLYMA